MEFMTVKETATKWGLSERRLQTICNEGMIPGVIKFGRSWAIPVNAQKPVDKRIKSGKYVNHLMDVLYTVYLFNISELLPEILISISSCFTKAIRNNKEQFAKSR